MCWEKSRRASAERQFRKGRAISEYLSPNETLTAGLVTLLFSGRTTTLTYGRDTVDGFGGRGRGRHFRYSQNQQAIWESLVLSHLPVDVTWLETQSPEKLARYKVAILSDARSLASREIEWLRTWVEEGGVLSATGGSTLHDQWDRELENYALSDVFGVDYVETRIRPPESAYLYVERDLKPHSGIGRIRFVDKSYLEHTEGKSTAEYEKGLGYDVVRVTSGRVVGVWEDGTPAVVENRYGKGLCMFLSSVYPGLSHTTGGWTVDALYKEYWGGAKELMAGCVRRGMQSSKVVSPIDVRSCPETVEVALRRQSRKNRWLVHLLNMDPKVNLVKGVVVSVRPGEGMSPEDVYYPYPQRKRLRYRSKGGELSFRVRNFGVHELIVVTFMP